MNPPRYTNLGRLHLPPRPSNAQEELRKILDALVEDYGAEKIIAFGSAVRGGVTEHSDVDLCVIREHPTGCTHPRLEAGLSAARSGAVLPNDLLVLTPGQWEQRQQDQVGVYKDICEEGVALYER